MNNESLEELTNLALPALRHAELVNFARTESPSKAYELALLRWPRRQAKAARSLAMLRRDFGVETLERLVMEHARPNGSEHAQTEKGSSMQLDTLYPEGVRNVALVRRIQGTDPKHVDSLAFLHSAGGEQKYLGFRDEVNRLQLDEAGTKVLVRRVITSMLDQYANAKAPQYNDMWSSALVATRTYLTDDNELLKRILNALVIYEFGSAKMPQYHVYMILPNPSEKPKLQDVIDYLLSFGFTEDEVRAMWVEMLRTRQRNRFKTAYFVDWWQGLKVGKDDLRKVADPIARQLLLHELEDILVKGCFDWNEPNYTRNGRAPEEFMEILDFLVYQTDYDWRYRNDETKELVESYFVKCVARGKVGTAHYMLVRYGHHFGFCRNDGIRQEEMPNAAMERIMRAALEEAEENRSCGIGTALAENLGEIQTADRLREIARSLNQRVALDYAFYHAVDMHK